MLRSKPTRSLSYAVAFVLSIGAMSVTVGPAFAEVIKPPAKSPLTVPGTGLKKGEQLKGTQRLLRKLVKVSGKEKKNYTFNCPGKTRVKGIGMFDPSTVGARVKDSNYPGKKSVTVTVYTLKDKSPSSGSIFALCS